MKTPLVPMLVVLSIFFQTSSSSTTPNVLAPTEGRQPFNINKYDPKKFELFVTQAACIRLKSPGDLVYVKMIVDMLANKADNLSGYVEMTLHTQLARILKQRTEYLSELDFGRWNKQVASALCQVCILEESFGLYRNLVRSGLFDLNGEYEYGGWKGNAVVFMTKAGIDFYPFSVSMGLSMKQPVLGPNGQSMTTQDFHNLAFKEREAEKKKNNNKKPRN